MESRVKSFLKNYIIIIWIIILTFALSTIVVLATYKNSSNVAKKVVATQAETDYRFSSNYLEEALDSSNPNDPKYKNYSVMISDGEAINVDIRNYGKTNSTLLYPTEINFNLTAVLTDSSGNELSAEKAAELLGSDTIFISLNNTTIMSLNASNRSSTLAQTVARGIAATINSYKVLFPNATTKAYVKIVAAPSDAHKDLRTIGAVFSVSDKSNIQGNGWKGGFNDSTQTSPENYDAFNYSLTGYVSSSTATIKWNPDVLNIDASRFNFYTGVTPSVTNTNIAEPSGWSQITFSLNESAGRYSFQIFKGAGFSTAIANLTSNWNEDSETSKEEYLWEHMDDYIIFDDGI